MSNKKKSDKDKNERKRKPEFYNDQLGENPGEGRMMGHPVEKNKK